MKTVIKFIVLAVIAFALGASLAWFQNRQNMPAGETPALETAQDRQIEVSPVVVGDRMRRGSTIEGAPDMPSALDTLYGDTAASPAPDAEADEPVSDAPLADAAPAQPDATATSGQRVAGSSVGGSFTMVDHNGAAVTEKSWPGKKKLVFFGFTHCPDICPAALDKMGAALAALGDKAGHIQPIFVTTDPKRDTPERLKEYLADYDSRIVGLTGSDAQVDHIKSIYKVYAAIAEGGDADNYLMDHSGYVYLMSENDELLEIFGSGDGADAIVKKSAPHLK